MLPKERRISKTYFPYIIQGGKKSNSTLFLLYVAKIIDSDKAVSSRFSFSVSKKVAKSAVLRNKLRRRGYSAVNDILKDIPKGYLFFFVYKKGAEEAGYQVIKDEIIKLLSDYIVIK